MESCSKALRKEKPNKISEKETPVKIYFLQSLINLDGSPLETVTAACPACGRATEKRTLTLYSVCAEALLAQLRDENPPGEEKARRYQLALKITNEDEIELTPEEAVLIRSLVAKVYGPLVVGQVWELLM